MRYGCFHPYPRRYAGGKSTIETTQESIARQRGTSFEEASADNTSIVWLENHAVARALVVDGWCTNERLSYQRDPDKMTDMLPRWEKNLAIRPPPNATENERRTEVKRRRRRLLDATGLHARLYTTLLTNIPSYFVAVEYISLANANVHVPDGSYPWGTVADGAPWTSTVAHILVRLQRPAGATEYEFFQAASRVVELIDPILPAWCTLDWYRAPSIGTPINVVGGPSAGGFYLDEPNLDILVFDV